ncbi:unnamed protein product [Oikopleura dioica]|uniref:Uncharacterized protein n=1 Tax=Oikopleura dioica TaxID=34765 RepID=E4X2I8_OIKDI|nr:unnamed protein product [Oikopleura dioica]
MPAGGAMKRVRPERFVTTSLEIEQANRTRIPSKASSVFDDENSNTTDESDQHSLFAQIKQLDNSLGNYWNVAPERDSLGRRPRKRTDRLQIEEETKSNGDPNSPVKRKPSIKKEVKKEPGDLSDEDSFNESTGLSVHQASDLEDFKEEPKEIQKLTGAKKRKAKTRPKTDLTSLKVRLMLNRHESQLSQTMEKLCGTQTPSELIKDVSKHLMESYNSQPLILKSEKTILCHIKDVDFEEKTKPKPCRSPSPDRDLPISKKAEQELKLSLKKRLADRRILDRDPSSDTSRTLVDAKSRLFAYLSKNFNHDGTRRNSARCEN